MKTPPQAGDPRPTLPGTALLLGLATAGGFAASWLGVPMPFLIGALVVVAAYAVAASSRTGRAIPFPQDLREVFVGCIGAMIGATFSPALVSVVPTLWLSLLGMVAFVVLNQGLGFVFFHRVARYDRTTAVYAAMPGGLVEAVTLGEQAGADVQLLSVQHFARVVLVVVAVPMVFLVLRGEAVGSSAGQAYSQPASGWRDVGAVMVIALVGAWLGPKLRLPASHMMGPLILSAGLHAAGVIAIESPFWLLALSQLVVGAGLGALFAGARPALLARAFATGAVSVALMLGVAAGFAFGLAPLVPVSVEALFISFAPGGVTEMGLVALSLGVSPVVVAVHHLFRISLTVLIASRLR